MDREELKGLIQGISVAVPAPFDDDYNLDLAKAAELTRLWVEDGLGTNTAFIKLASAWGQGPDLSDNEWPHLLRTVVDAGGSDVVVMQGLRSRGTVLVIDDAKRAQDLGAVSLQIELPFHHGPNQDDYVRYFTDISDAIDIGIMIYNTYWFGCAPLTADTMLRLADAEHVVAIKWNMPDGHDYDDMRQFSHIFNVLDNSGDMVRCHKNGGARLRQRLRVCVRRARAAALAAVRGAPLRRGPGRDGPDQRRHRTREPESRAAVRRLPAGQGDDGHNGQAQRPAAPADSAAQRGGASRSRSSAQGTRLAGPGAADGGGVRGIPTPQTLRRPDSVGTPQDDRSCMASGPRG